MTRSTYDDAVVMAQTIFDYEKDDVVEKILAIGYRVGLGDATKSLEEVPVDDSRLPENNMYGGIERGKVIAIKVMEAKLASRAKRFEESLVEKGIQV